LLDGHRPKSKGGASVPHVADLPHAQGRGPFAYIPKGISSMA
jgi:hypothetical protein